MNLNPIGDIVGTVANVIDSLHTSDKEKAELAIENRKLYLQEKGLDQANDLANIEVNKEEAKNQNWFVAGWRPGLGWVGVAAMAWQFVVYPLLIWVWFTLQAFDVIPKGLEPPPILDIEALWVILSGMLGIATMRTYEKKNRVN